MPMVIAILMNIAVLKIKFRIDESERFLAKSNRIIFDIETKIHTSSK